LSNSPSLSHHRDYFRDADTMVSRCIASDAREESSTVNNGASLLAITGVHFDVDVFVLEGTDAAWSHRQLAKRCSAVRTGYCLIELSFVHSKLAKKVFLFSQTFGWRD